MNESYIQIGTVLGDRYEILEKIGNGGMAHVYKAHCRVLNRMVAIKVLREEFVGDAAFTKRFVTEAQAAAALNHANIVSIFDVCIEGNLYYIVMELVENVTLKDYIEKNGALDWQTAVKFELQLCSALACAHKHGVIHQDIKPQNILLTGDGAIKVTDFGIARAASSSTIVAGEAGGGAIGSVHYCSPEQARGGFTDEKTDIYAAGVVLYEMLTGHVPFDGDTPVAVAMKHMHDQVPAPTESNPAIPKDLETVVFHAMNREKRNRYASATAMMEDLQSVLAGTPVRALTENGEEAEAVHKRRGSAQRKSDKKKDKDVRKNDKWIMLASVFCALALLVGGAALYLSVGGQANEVQVPKVVELTQEEAEKRLEESKLKMEVEEIVYDTEYEEGIVVEQDPIEGKTVQAHFKIKVRVSGGKETLKIPNVVNMDIEDAIDELESYGFKVTRRSQYSEDLPKDVVVRQSPEANREAHKGDTVIVYVNDRSEASVPEVYGMTVARAKTLLEEKGFKLGRVTEEESAQEKGTVIRQSPASGSNAERGSAVSIVISTGEKEPEKEETPSNPEPPAQPVKVKTISIPVPQNKDTTHIRIVANGQTIHDAPHSKSEISFDLKVTGKSSATLEIYHDGIYKATQTIVF